MRHGLTVGAIAACALALLTGCASTASDRAVTELTAEDRALYEAGLATLAEFWDVDNPPHFEVVRWLNPEDVDATIATCMGELGFPISEDGSYSFGEQRDAWGAAQYECAAKYPILPRYTAPWGAEQVAAQYEWTLKGLIPCLERAGYSVTDVPSRATFIDTWSSTPFYPFAQLPDSADFVRLEYDCPQQAPAAVLWDGADPATWTRR